jgi:hypothetical protein
MIKYAAIAIFVLRLAYQPYPTQVQDATLSEDTSSIRVSAPVISNVKVQASAGRTTIEWDVKNNSNTSLFEIEKSVDGREFRLTALVFGSEDEDLAHYTFFEKTGRQPVQYRIKMVTREDEILYAGPVKVKPVK